MTLEALRGEFPVLERLAYLNAGTCGPVPAPAVAAAREALALQAERGRGDRVFFEEHAMPAAGRLRERAAALLGCEAGELALTGATTDGVNTVIAGLELGPGDEVLTSDEEHPGLLAPVLLGSRRRGFSVRIVPFAELADEVRPATRLVACSHVSWIGGQVVDAAALRATRAPVLLDGAQGLGAVATDVRALSCDFYAASGQKWLCGPNGSGYLYVRAERLDDLHPPWPGYGTLAAPERPDELSLRKGAARLDLGFPAPHQSAWANAALDVLEQARIDAVLEAGPKSAAGLAQRLAERGLTVAPRGHSTLVSWEDPDPPAAVGRLARAGIVVRHLPERPYVRASVGAWTSDEELDRLVAAAAP